MVGEIKPLQYAGQVVLVVGQIPAFAQRPTHLATFERGRRAEICKKLNTVKIDHELLEYSEKPLKRNIQKIEKFTKVEAPVLTVGSVHNLMKFSTT